MRLALAIAAVVLLLAAMVAPHAHEGRLGTHACLACVTAAAEEASAHTPEVAPRVVVASAIPSPLPANPVTGRPLGAIPGQSPPRA